MFGTFGWCDLTAGGVGVTNSKFTAFLWRFKTNEYPAVYQRGADVHTKISAGLGRKIRPAGSKSSRKTLKYRMNYRSGHHF